jgi:hypothetical protein
MVNAHHLYSLHHTYTGKGCALCGKSAEEHQQDFWMVDGKQVSPNDLETVRPSSVPRPKSLIEELMYEAGVEENDPDWGHQFNLTHASLSDFGIRCGLDPRIKEVMQRRGLGELTEKGLIEFIELLVRCGIILKPLQEFV